MHLNANLLHFYVQIFKNVKFFHLFILRHNHFSIDGYVSFSFSVFLMFYSFILLVRLFCKDFQRASFWPFDPSTTWFLKCVCVSWSPGRFVKHRLVGPMPWGSDSVGLWGSLRIGISTNSRWYWATSLWHRLWEPV